MGNSSVLFSEVYSIETSEDDDWFDPRLDRDTPLCIDPYQVFKSKDPIFVGCKQKFSLFFRYAFNLAASIGEVPSDIDKKNKNLSSTYKKLTEIILVFPEVHEVCLGFTKRSTRGSGLGEGFARDVADALIRISQKSNQPPRHFEQIEIFTPGIGKDMISDTTGNLIKKELIDYTRSICEKLGIKDEHLKYTPVYNCDYDFEYNIWDDNKFYLPQNPFNKKPILLVPKSFLREIPSISSGEFYQYIKSKSNSQMRARLNFDIHRDLESSEMEKEAADDINSSIKSRILEQIEGNPQMFYEILEEFVDEVEECPEKFTQYNFETDSKNIVKIPRLVKDFIEENPLPKIDYHDFDSFCKFINSMLSMLKQFVEDEKYNGYKHLWQADKSKGGEEATENSSQINLKFKSQQSTKQLTEELLGEYCYKYKIRLEKESGLGKHPVKFTNSLHTEKAWILAKTINNISFEEEELSRIVSEAKRKKVKYLCYIAFIENFELLAKLQESIQELDNFKFGKIIFNLMAINASQQRDLDMPLSESKHMIQEKEVCVSYARGGASSEVVDEICKTLRANNISVIRDSDEVEYKDSLKSFMRRLGQGKCVIIVISDKYLKSKYCMFELTEFLDAGNFKERIIPLCLDDAKIYDLEDMLPYTSFWEQKLNRANEAVGTVSFSNISPNTMEEVKLYSKIAEMMNNFLGEVGDMAIPPINIHRESNFQDVIREVNKTLSK